MVLARRRKFVLAYPKDKHVSDLNQKIVGLGEDVRVLGGQVKTHEVTIEKKDGEIQRMTRRYKEVDFLREGLNTSLEEARGTVRRMEDDMAKIRSEIGDGRWREIMELRE
jgi:chromosome segregation ATPase